MKIILIFFSLFFVQLPTKAQSWEYTLVDLGLPSGTLWADRNLGAPTPYEPGDFYAWGETTTKTDYSAETYTLSTKEYFSFLSSDHDAAYISTDGKCKMPNQNDYIELCRECKWEWQETRYYHGMKVTGPNGNSIFLLAAGLMQGGSNTWRDSGNYLSENDIAYSNADYVGCRFLDFQRGGLVLQIGEDGNWYYRRGIKKLREDVDYMLNSDVKYWGRLIRPIGVEKVKTSGSTASREANTASKKSDSKSNQGNSTSAVKENNTHSSTKRRSNVSTQQHVKSKNANKKELLPL